MRRLFSFTVPLLLALALPALAQASTGTVLSVSQSKHQVQLVNAHEVVHAYRFRGHLNGVESGTKLSYRAAGSRITQAKALGPAGSFSFLGRVVSSGKAAVVLSLGDSQQLRLATTKQSSAHLSARAERAHCDSSSGSAPTITININGARPGETVLVTESTDSSGDVTITITVPPTSGSTSGSTPSTPTVSAAHATSIGTITAVSPTSITVDASSGSSGAQTLTVANPSVTVGFIVGDSVNVTYEQDGSEFVAEQVEYDNRLTSGVVTALAAGTTGFDTITLTDDFSDQSETFYAPVALLEGQGTLLGHDIGISYYQATHGLTLDHLQDRGAAN